MPRHLVLGSGPVGTAIARRLATEGPVVLASRSGTGPALAGVVRLALDATDPEAVSVATAGVDVVHNALNPSAYHRWAAEWPRLWAAVTAAAERHDALLVTVSNLYGYGVPDGLMREDTPLRPRGTKARIRAAMWEEAEAAHRAGRFRAAEVRASDYLGPGTVSSASRLVEAAVAGRTFRVVGGLDTPHSWTYPDDVARLVVAVATDDGAHGRVWHVPTNPPRSQRELAADVAAAAGRPAPRVRRLPDVVLRAAGLVDPDARAVREVTYQFAHPFVIDDTAARARFGLLPTPWGEVLAATTTPLTTTHENGTSR